MANEMKTPYRGNCGNLTTINEVPIDISALIKENRPISPEEPIKRFLPVMAQITWFKLRHGDDGTISTELVSNTDMQVVVRANIFVKGQSIASAYGSANVVVESNGNNGEYWLIETAESRAVSRALRYAGFGCQLDLDYLDEDIPSNSTSSNQTSTGTAEPASAESEAAVIPGTVSGKDVKIDANAASSIVDISDLEASMEENVEQSQPNADMPAITNLHRRSQKRNQEKKISKSDPEPQNPTVPQSEENTENLKSETASSVPNEYLMKVEGKYLYLQRTDAGWDYTIFDAETNQQLDGGQLDAPESSSSKAIASVCELQGLNSRAIHAMPLSVLEKMGNAQLPEQGPVTEEKIPTDESTPSSLDVQEESTAVSAETTADTALEGSEEHEGQSSLFHSDSEKVSEMDLPEGKAPEDLVKDYIQLALQGGYPDPILDPEFFGEENQDPEAFFINRGNRQTKMRNRDLQWAIDYLDSNKELLLDIQYPAPSGSFAGKTYRQLYAEYPSDKMDAILEKAVMLYYGSKFPNYAALLLILKQRRNEK